MSLSSKDVDFCSTCGVRLPGEHSQVEERSVSGVVGLGGLLVVFLFLGVLTRRFLMRGGDNNVVSTTVGSSALTAVAVSWTTMAGAPVFSYCELGPTTGTGAVFASFDAEDLCFFTLKVLRRR